MNCSFTTFFKNIRRTTRDLLVYFTEKIKPGDIITDQFHPSSMTYANPFCVELLISHENLLFTFIRCFNGFILIYFKKNLKLAVNINLAAAPRFVDKSDVLDQLRYIK